jgi:hypothetical protein
MATRRALHRGSGGADASRAPSTTSGAASSVQRITDTIDSVLSEHDANETVQVPVRFLASVKEQFQELERRSTAAAAAAAGVVDDDDTILDKTIQDSDVRSTLRQTFSSRSPAPAAEESNSLKRTSLQQQRRTSAESLNLVRKVLEQQRLSSHQQDMDEFVALVWHLCQGSPVAGPDMTDNVRARILAAYSSIGSWGIDVRSIRRLFGDVPGSELVFVVLAAVHKLKLGPFLVCFQGTDAMWSMFALLSNYVWSVADAYPNNPCVRACVVRDA